MKDKKISVKLKKDIKVVDFQKPARFSAMSLPKLPEKEINYLWVGVQLSFSVSLSPDDKLSYIPTQYIAELFKNQGYDGIAYESVQRKDYRNLVLFDRSNVEPGKMDERSIYGIKYTDNVEYARKHIEEGGC